MYKIEYLPVARQDMVETVNYISRELQNPVAAERLAIKMIEAIDGLVTFPYVNPLHYPIRPLEQEYRKLFIQNYIVFYWIDEEKKTIIIARVIYARRDLEKAIQ
jgi:Plasmid stabilization system protein